jgi:hypothetical protein
MFSDHNFVALLDFYRYTGFMLLSGYSFALILDAKDEGFKFLRNVSRLSPGHTALYPRTHKTS